MYFLLTVSAILTFDEEVSVSVAVIILGILLTAGYALAFPICCSFTPQKITVCYIFGFTRKQAAWKELKWIEDNPSKFPFPWSREYHIAYFKTKFPLWKIACIPKNKRTASLIAEFYSKTVRKTG